MSYTLLAGRFVIRYADLPRQGPEPDGDTVKFVPDTRALVETLPRPSGTGPDINARGISVRLEGIDALETHFAESHQELAGANAARDLLLAELGFTDVTFFDDLPNKIESAGQDSIRGHVLSNGIDANGRLIGFVYAGDPTRPDGASLFLLPALMDMSINAALLAAGHAYPTFYDTLPADLREHLAVSSRAARDDRPPRELWARATADPDGAATVRGLAQLEELVIWPKLFRRVVVYLASGFADFDGFDAWLRADSINRDDGLFLLERRERANLHDVVVAAGDTLRLTVWPEDFIITPDPAPPVPATSSPRPAQLADVMIIAALPDPVGADAGGESVTLINTIARTIDLAGWELTDAAGNSQPLRGELAAGATLRVVLAGVALGNSGDSILVADAQGAVIDRVAYGASQVRPGRTIVFAR